MLNDLFVKDKHFPHESNRKCFQAPRHILVLHPPILLISMQILCHH
uniref:Uncharacterized protein n=1 Tax=Anguilla anguilla TaxID=7936 RepID=A0A0E9S7Z2_ANGAN